MGLRQCDKCGDMVDEAKAFCPGCGNAFVEEKKRQHASEFEQLDSTVQLGNTMYNQMLSDMGLNISKAPNPEKRIEVIAPAAESGSPSSVGKASIPAGSTGETKSSLTLEKPNSGGRIKWILIALIASVILLPPALLSAVSVFYEIWLRLK
jgi:hypothetical protein